MCTSWPSNSPCPLHVYFLTIQFTVSTPCVLLDHPIHCVHSMCTSWPSNSLCPLHVYFLTIQFTVSTPCVLLDHPIHCVHSMFAAVVEENNPRPGLGLSDNLCTVMLQGLPTCTNFIGTYRFWVSIMISQFHAVICRFLKQRNFSKFSASAVFVLFCFPRNSRTLST